MSLDTADRELNGTEESLAKQDTISVRQLTQVFDRLQKLEFQVNSSQEKISKLETDNETLRMRLEQQGFDGLRSDILELKRSRKEEKAVLENLKTQISVPPLQFTIHKFSQLKKDNEQWYSTQFYTHPQGYKMCLKVYPNGDGPGKNKHLLVSARLMRGEFDSYLKWPFRAAVTVTLINQEEDKKHFSDVLEFGEEAPDSAAGRVLDGEKAQSGVGNPEFFPHSKLEPRYLKHDCIRLMVSDVQFL